MAELTEKIDPIFTEYVISLLRSSKIYTDVDFIRGDPEKLSKLINIGNFDESFS